MPKQKCILTILICCYNSEKFLKKCFESLVKQKKLNLGYRVLFVDDASTDRSLEIVRTYSKVLRGISLIENKNNSGLVACCNKALNIIDTPYFMRLDSDDYLSYDATEKIFKELNSIKKCDFIVFKRWDVYGNELKEINITDDMYTWIAVGTLFRTDAVKLVGGYSDTYWEEYDLYIKLLKAGYKFKLSPYPIYYYIRDRVSMTQNHAENEKGFRQLLRKWGENRLKNLGDFQKLKSYY